MLYIVFQTVRPDPIDMSWLARWATWLGRWTCFVTQSPLAHVAVIKGDRVIECNVNGTHAYPRGKWLSGNRWQLHGYYTVVEPWPVDSMLNHIASLGVRRAPWWRYELCRLLHWLSRGSIPFWHCTSPVLALLAEMGMNPPLWITEPRQLQRWINDQGFDYIALSRSDRNSPNRWRIGEDTGDDR